MRKISRPGLIRAVDKAFSRYIRKRAADHAGWCECVTCGLSVPLEDIQAGHFVKRGHASVRWDERNVFPQCKGCNHFKDGAQDEMALHIVKIHGVEVLHELLRLKHTAKHWTMPELRELLEKYRET